ncbi:MAG: efflux transporter outer membrane subunit [Methylotenera sp.]|uniref:efflux transporter outer membrane subunit n=1 Tax=Methylotenera sp. TaxID=2051956 RepID=UPI001850C128|nr:efflux transporter outer membrane subunit [Methylotenera sp.]NOU24519.1 efflux transporter outer membrane subunit [Methylotenera sp.]
MQPLTLNEQKLFNIRLTGLIVSALFLSACQSVGPNYTRPELPVPAQYSETVDQTPSKVSQTWWTQYQDATLNALLDKALQNNADIKLAIARIDEAEAFANEVGAATLPQVDLNAGASRTRSTELGGNPVNVNPRNNYKAQLGTAFEVDFWGKIARAKESARAQVLSSRYAKDTVALSLSGLVTGNYLVLRSLDSQIAIVQNNIKSRDESLALTKRRLEGGVASGLDVRQAEVATANLSAQLAELNRLRALSLHQLAVLTGDLSLHIAGADIQALPVPPTPPAGLPSALLEARPDVRQAEEQMIAANAKIGVAKAALYPTISLTASLGGESLELGDILKSAARIWTGGVSLYLPIFDSGKLNARVDQASAKQKQALASYESAVQSAFREVNDALVNLRQNTEREAALYRSQEAAKKALAISENRYQSGYSAYLDVLDAQRVYNDAALSFVQSRQARLLATVDLFKALGGGWQAN